MKENTAQVVAQVPVDVGTFLLNEKRPEIHGIETRFKVNVLLVPNTYLETPNYKVQRLRHDDLNQSEPLPASFDMMERPEEEDVVKQKKEEAREPRQEAAVKGITSGQPAPMPIERQPVSEAPRRENWLSNVMSWFKRQPIEVAPPAPAPQRREAQREPRDERGRGRRDRTERPERRDQREPRDGRGQDRGDVKRDGQRGEPREQLKQRPPQGGQQQPRRDRESGRDGPREAQKQRPPREPRQPQQPQESRAADPTQAAITQGQPSATHDSEHGEGSRRRRDRRRGGRDRGERNVQGEPRGDRGGQRSVTPQASAPNEEVAPTTRAEAIPDERTFQVAAPAPDDRPHETPVASAPAAVLETAPDSEIVRVEPQGVRPAPVPTTVQVPELPRNAPEIPRVALELPPESGLILVETTHAAPTIGEETEPARPRRVRPPRVASADEPLQMVETTHKDSTPT
jgi:ribonuclease E